MLYIMALEVSLDDLLDQANLEGKEDMLYYLSFHFLPTKAKYSPIEDHFEL